MRLRPITAATALLALLPLQGWSLGLGGIHVKSSLNAPLDVEIDLIDATPEELAGLQPQLASRDTFRRYGIDYPSYLASLNLRKGKSADGRDVIHITSPAPVTEPFATLLVEAVYPRGRLVREYSVLLDPPVFADRAAAAALVAPPVAAPAVRPQAPAAAAAPAPAPRPPAVPAAPAAGAVGPVADAQRYTVQRGDTLSHIAGTLVGETGVPRHRQAMVAIYQGNSDAFDGNANLLRRGAILQLPSEQAISAVDPAAALAELRRQNAAWRGEVAAQPSAAPAPAAAATDPRLKLVPPAAPAPGAPVAPAVGTAALEQRVTILESELADVRRQLEARNAELASTKAELATARQGQGSASTAPVQVTAPPPVAPKPAATPTPAVDSLLTTLLADWRLSLGVAAALVGLLVLLLRRRSVSVPATDDRFEARREPVIAPAASATPFDDTDVNEHGFLVEESQPPEPGPAPVAAPARPATRAPAAAAAPALVPENDALQEAELYMAYGLFDQAAALLEAARKRDPARRDLLLKLVDVCFMWGNKDAFLKAAQDVSDVRAQGPAGDWDKILIMGRQLAPEHALFQEMPSAPRDAGGMDLNLEGGQNLIDFDVFDEPAPPPPPAAESLPVELDLSIDDPLEQAPSVAGAQRAEPQLRSQLDADIPAVDRTAEININDLDLGGVDFDLGDGALDDSRVLRALQDAPPATADGRPLDAATLSEVGTKLDLARAYIDMGDPSGARSILDEVLQEGSAAQRQEARRMIDAIPG